MLNILLADDHDIVRRGLRQMFQGHQGWYVCAEAANGREAVKLASDLKPDVAVLDLFMPELNGVDATRQIKRDCPRTEILIFAERGCDHLVGEALRAGARGLVLKSDEGKDVIAAVEALSHHQPFFSSQVSESLLDVYLKGSGKASGNSGFSVLTNREREIVQLIAEARTNKEVARTLCISVKTVETHRSAVMRKLGVNSIVQLVHYAVRNQLIQV